MYYVDKNGNKIRKEPFQNPSEMAQLRRAPVRENYTGSKKCPVWLYWVLGGIALIVLIVLITMWLKPKKKVINK